MVKKVFFSSLAVLVSLVSLWGVIYQAWTWEMFGPVSLAVVLLGVAFRVDDGLSRAAVPSDSEEKRLPSVTQRYEFGALTGND
jgi:hypothetical protein